MIAAASNRRRSQFLESALFWAFRIGTYFVLLCATYIFLDIGIKGGRTVFTRTAPFVNLKFLSEPPQTLYVFDYQGKKMELSDREFREWKTTHKEDVDVTSVSYSAGGIWPCIVGTALLVIGSMTLALFIGISCAIYLSEYSRDCRFIRAIDRVRAFRVRVVRDLLWLECFVALGLVHARLDGLAGHHHCQRRIIARGAAGVARRLARARRDQVADHPEKCLAVCVAGNFDLFDPRDRPGRGRNGANHVHRCLRHARRNAVAGEPLD